MKKRRTIQADQTVPFTKADIKALPKLAARIRDYAGITKFTGKDSARGMELMAKAGFGKKRRAVKKSDRKA